MFEELGLNVARQPDNAGNPRPDNRSGWLAGETPDVLEDVLGASEPPAVEAQTVAGAPRPTLTVRLWDPSTQLRYRAKRAVEPRPDGAPNRARERA
jgi:biotin synthase